MTSDDLIQTDRPAIGPGKRVTLHFALLLDSGEVVDSTRNGQPATFEVGDGNLLPGVEMALYGLRAGDDAQLPLAPEQAFGAVNPDNVHLMPRARFSADEDLEPGTVVSFEDPGGGQLPGIVKAVTDSTVEVDFNHPLAGRALVFDVTVLKVESAFD